ncbi:hypothetical protein J6590_031760 [Homalodisca vitripennis]|nr:hypothetical protein J6590_031760 [Homalodisca vitripennis]
MLVPLPTTREGPLLRVAAQIFASAQCQEELDPFSLSDKRFQPTTYGQHACIPRLLIDANELGSSSDIIGQSMGAYREYLRRHLKP